MAISKEAYKMLESVVGVENISEDPTMLDVYGFHFLAELQRKGTGTKFLPQKAGAVVLPASEMEVKGIISVCNRFGLKSKAHSTAFGSWNAHSWEDAVIIDLRRMNRIVEIDEKNMYAVVEPYVTWAQLQAETMKRGLTPSLAGVGCQTSPLANVTSGLGMGPFNISMGFNERSALGVEWVLPDGEILRMGSVGSGAGWFCGDGPGPSLRGIMRGEYGNMGGLGVITKCAIKLFHWPGPSELPVGGAFPNLRLSEDFSDKYKLFLITFDDRDKRNQAIRRIGEAEIAYQMYAWGHGFLLAAVPELSHLIPRKPEDPKPSQDPVLAMSIASSSPAELAYQEKVLMAILEETGGNLSDYMDIPGVKTTVFRYLTRPDYLFTCLARFASGWWITLFDFVGTPESITTVQEKAIGTLEKWEGKNILLGCSDSYCQPMYEAAHVGYLDHSGGYYDVCDSESRDSYTKMIIDINRPLVKENFIHPTIASNRANQRAGEIMCNFHIWQKKIKAAFDPNSVSDGGYYIEIEE
jgi:glycolate dehydrogenase FAD-linked subunit